MTTLDCRMKWLHGKQSFNPCSYKEYGLSSITESRLSLFLDTSATKWL